MSRWLWIGGVGLVILLALLGWGIVAGIERLAGGKQIAERPVQKAEEMLPGLKELVPPKLGQKVEEWAPGAALPRQDVGGENITGVSRSPGMVRVALGVQEQKRRVTCKGKDSFAEVIASYAREIATLGFTKDVTAASLAEETHV